MFENKLKLYYSISSVFTLLLFFLPTSIQASQVYFIHSDHLGSTSVVTDNNGEAVQSEYYYPFGSSRSPSLSIPDDSLPTTQDSQPPITEHQFTSQISDEDQTGLYYYNARYYNPQIAKFTQADTAKDGPNGYSYVGNNPINYIDPSGKKEIGVFDKRIDNLVDKPFEFANYSYDKKILAMALMSETYNGKVSENGMMFMALFMVQRHNSGSDIMDTAFAALVNGVIRESYYENEFNNKSISEKTNFALKNCLENPIECREQSQRFQKSLEYINKAESYLSNDMVLDSNLFKSKDHTYFAVTNGLTFNSNNKGIIAFSDINHKLMYLFLNFEQYKMDNPGFNYNITMYTDNDYNNMHIAIAGNDTCTWTLSCGSYRKEAHRLDKLDSQFGDYVNQWKKDNVLPLPVIKKTQTIE